MLYAHVVISELEPPSSQSAQKHVSKQMSLPGVNQGGELVVGSGSGWSMPQSVLYRHAGYSAPGPPSSPSSQQPSEPPAGVPMRVTVLMQRGAEGAAGARDVDAGGRSGLETGGCGGESAIAVVLSECTCRRKIAAYHRSAVSSFGEHGCVAWKCHAEGEQGRSWRGLRDKGALLGVA